MAKIAPLHPETADNPRLEALALGFGYHRLFAARAALHEALDYAYTLINSLPAESQVAAYTALHVVLNTVALDRARADQAVQEETSCPTT